MRDAPKMDLDADGLRIGIVMSLYHEEVTTRLRNGAVSAFVDAGGDEDDLYEVASPGAFELVPLVDALAQKEIDGVVALGCIIRGETTHDEHLARSISHLLAHIAFEHEMAIGFGVLTCLSSEQAMERAGGMKGNKGEEAMNAVIATARGLQSIEEDLPDAEDDDLEIEYEYVDEDADADADADADEGDCGEYEYEEEEA